jgi:ABC-type sugar transport system ATPase subunit
MATLLAQALEHRYPHQSAPGLAGVDLDIAEGETVCVVGPLGSGKTTLLRILSGAEPRHNGRVLIDGEDVTGLDAEHRGVNRVFDRHRLYPHMTLAENLSFPLLLYGVGRERARERVLAATTRLGIVEHLDQRASGLGPELLPHVSAARALVARPRILIADDPLRNLAPDERSRTAKTLALILRRMGLTTVYATTDAEEALALGGRIVHLDSGRIVSGHDTAVLPATAGTRLAENRQRR